MFPSVVNRTSSGLTLVTSRTKLSRPKSQPFFFSWRTGFIMEDGFAGVDATNVQEASDRFQDVKNKARVPPSIDLSFMRD
jgi:hypothetical protein